MVLLYSVFFLVKMELNFALYTEVFTGNVWWNEKSQFITALVNSSEQVDMIRVSYSIDFDASSNSCCPFIYLRHTGQENGYGTDRNCFYNVDDIGKLNELDPRLLLVNGNNQYCSFNENYNIYTCSKTIDISNGFDAFWYISVGYSCLELRKNIYLGLNYTVEMAEIEHAKCEPMSEHAHRNNIIQEFYVTTFKMYCQRFYSFYSEINTLGMKIREINEVIRQSFASNKNTIANDCYFHDVELGCRIFLPECVNGTISHPCNDMCLDLKQGCKGKSLDGFDIVSTFSCNNYLFHDHGSNCIHRKVTCPAYKIDSQVILNTETADMFYAGKVILNSCKNCYQLKGSANRTCQLNGKWTGEIPLCILHPAIIPTSCSLICIIILTVLVMLCSYCRTEIHILLCNLRIFRTCQGKQKTPNGNDSNVYDAFVSYDDQDLEFVRNELVKELENNHPLYKLCIEERDFLPGESKVNSIAEAVNKSYSALIILTEHYINNNWCMHEFEHSYHKNYSDSTFKLIMVLDESVLKLPSNKIPTLVKPFLRTKTFLRRTAVVLKRTDILFWDKLRQALPNYFVKDKDQNETEF